MANIPLKSITFPGLDDVYTVPVVDNTLAVAGGAADAKKTGDEITAIKADLGDLSELETTEKGNLVAAINEAAQSGGSGGGGVSATAISLLGDLLRLAMYNVTDLEGIASKITALEAALAVGEGYAAVTYNLSYVLSSNTASSVEIGASYTTTLTAASSAYAIDSVTVTMDGTDITSTAYNNGVVTIAEVTGLIEITASARAAAGLLYHFDLTLGLTDLIEGVTATKSSGVTLSESGATWTAVHNYINFGNIFDRDRSYVIQCGTFDRRKSNAVGRLLMVANSDNASSGGAGLAYKSNDGWTWYNGAWGSIYSGYSGTDASVLNAFGGHRVTMYVDADGYMYFYDNGTLIGQSTSALSSNTYTAQSSIIIIGSSANDALYNATIESLKVYEGNYEEDAA